MTLNADKGDDFLDALTGTAAALSLETIPSSTVRAGRRVLVDTAGVILAGMHEPEMKSLAGQVAVESDSADATVWGSHRQADTMWVALLHGTAGLWHELDGGHRFSGGHPAAYVVGAGFPVAEREKASGKRLLESIIGGYEVAARVGLGTTLRSGMDAHGSWPTLGAATTAGLLLGYDRIRLRETLNISTSLNLASSNRAAREGATVRNVYAGFGAAMGVLAADLVKDGFTGERDGISTVFGNIAGVFLDVDKILENLGTRWEIERGYHRLHACARGIHSSLDALRSILSAHTVSPAEIERIDVQTYSMAATMNAVAPENSMAAKFSIPHSVAAYLTLGETGAEISSEAAIRNDQIRTLAKRVVLTDSRALTARTPSERPAVVRLSLRDGRRLEASVTMPDGEFDHRPLSDDQISEKFLRLASVPLGEKRATALLKQLWQIDSIQDIKKISPLYS